MQDDSIQIRASISVRDALHYLYGIHRPLLPSGNIGSDAYAEALGNFDIAYDAVKAAKEAALKEWEQPYCTAQKAEDAARTAAIAVFAQARKDNLIFLRNGTRSATVVRAFLIAEGLV